MEEEDEVEEKEEEKQKGESVNIIQHNIVYSQNQLSNNH